MLGIDGGVANWGKDKKKAIEKELPLSQPVLPMAAPSFFFWGGNGGKTFFRGEQDTKKSLVLTTLGGKTLKKSSVLTTSYRKMLLYFISQKVGPCFLHFTESWGQTGGGAKTKSKFGGICPLAHSWRRHWVLHSRIYAFRNGKTLLVVLMKSENKNCRARDSTNLSN